MYTINIVFLHVPLFAYIDLEFHLPFYCPAIQ